MTTNSNQLYQKYQKVDLILTQWMAERGITLLRLSLGVIYLWFGVLKFFPSLSPAEDLAARTIHKLTFGMVSAEVALPILATWECLIGIGLLTGVFKRAILLLLGVQMIGTISPVFFFANEVFAQVPLVPTLEGQYIIKNLVIISAAIVIGATVRGGRVIADPQVAQKARMEERSRATNP